MSGTIPEWALSGSVVVTLFTVMFGLGLGIAPGELRWIWRSRGPMARGLFAVLIAVPALALLVTRSLGLPPLAEVGIMLMAISPGAPVALRRSLDAGGHRAFAPSLQIAVALLSVVSMPLSIAVLDELYGIRASIMPWEGARQVLEAQLLPLGLGIALRYARAPLAARIEPRIARIGTLLLVATVLLLLVATQNSAPPRVNAVILAYLLVSVFAIVPYVAWRRRAGARATAAD